MTNGTLLQDLFRRLNYSSTPAPEVTARLQAFLNQTHREILSRPGLDSLRDDTLTIASVAAVATYGVPPVVAAVHGITDRTNDRQLRLRPLAWLRAADPGLNQSGTPSVYVLRGAQQVAAQPSNASELFLDSTDAGDVQTAYVEGIRTGGYPITLSKVLTGVTAVSVSTAITDLIEVTKFYLASPAIGTVTLHEDATGGTELARIPIGQTYARYTGIQLWPTPADVVTYYVDYLREIPEMRVATDEPLLPPDFHGLLVDGALVKEWTKKDDLTRREAAQRDYTRGLRDLTYRVTCPPEFLPSRLTTGWERSRLGPHFPATRW